MSNFSQAAFRHLRTALVRSAAAIIERSGSEALSLCEPARNAGVSSAAPYRHFASKEALLAEVARQGFEQLHGELMETGSGLDRERSFLVRCVGYVRFAQCHPALYRLMFGAFPDKQRYDGLVEAGDRLFALLNDALTPPAEDQPARAIGCWALVHGLAMLSVDGQLKMHLPGDGDASLLAVVRPLADTRMGTTKQVSHQP